MSVVSVKGLTKAYGSRPPALTDVTLEIAEGVTGLLGPNGAGKSTLLQCVLGLLVRFSGTATVLGHDARKDRLGVRRRVGYMPESDALLPRMSGVASCRLLGELSGLSRREALRRAHECLHYVGLTEHLYRSGEEYSTGMRQRLKLAQALVHDPDLLFLDEPVSGMDPQGREDFLRLVAGLARDHGKHVVWSSHLLPDVARVADGIVVLERGRVRGTFRLEDLAGATGRFDVEADVRPDDAADAADAGAGSGGAPLGSAMAFAAALARRGVATEDDAGRADPTNGRCRAVLSPPRGDPRAVIEAAHEAAVPLRRLSPVTERLEDVFHRLLERAPAARDGRDGGDGGIK